jgi:hypothetical protein
MKAFRVIFLVCLIFTLAGSAFAKNDKTKNGKDYEAAELDFKGPLKYELLVIAGAGVLLLERRRRHRRASLYK